MWFDELHFQLLWVYGQVPGVAQHALRLKLWIQLFNTPLCKLVLVPWGCGVFLWHGLGPSINQKGRWKQNRCFQLVCIHLHPFMNFYLNNDATVQGDNNEFHQHTHSVTDMRSTVNYSNTGFYHLHCLTCTPGSISGIWSKERLVPKLHHLQLISNYRWLSI